MQNIDVSFTYLSFLKVILFLLSHKDKKTHEDILTEFETEGFLVDLEEIMGRVKREISLLKPSTVPAFEEPSTTTHSEDSKGPTSKPHFGKSSSSITSSVLFPDTEGSGSGMNEWTDKPVQFTTTEITSEAVEGTSIKNEEKIIAGKGRINFASPVGKYPYKSWPLYSG